MAKVLIPGVLDTATNFTKHPRRLCAKVWQGLHDAQRTRPLDAVAIVTERPRKRCSLPLVTGL